MWWLYESSLMRRSHIQKISSLAGSDSRYLPRLVGLALGTNLEAALFLAENQTRTPDFSTTDHRLPQPWAVFTAKERASAPRPSHTRDLCLPGSRAHQRPSSRTSANSPERVRLLLKLVSSSETAMALPKSKSLLVRMM